MCLALEQSRISLRKQKTDKYFQQIRLNSKQFSNHFNSNNNIINDNNEIPSIEITLNEITIPIEHRLISITKDNYVSSNLNNYCFYIYSKISLM
jgi:hypothetical protein